jgi:agmatinase
MSVLRDREAVDRVNRPFVGIPTFLRAPMCTDLDQLDADIAFMGAPTDEGSPFMPGTRFGPRSIREQSLRFVGAGKGLYDANTGQPLLEYEMTKRRLADVGDADILPTNVPATFDNITDMVRGILRRDALPVVLGGDHAITYPVVRAYEEPIHVVHLDAHTDYAPFSHGLALTNGHAFRHIRRMSFVRSLTQIGMRGLRSPRMVLDDSRADGNRVVTMSEFRAVGASGALDGVEKDAKCFVSIDIDVLDMSLVPGCVSGEPDGMTYAELRDTLVYLAKQVEVVGFDFVEVNPQLDVGTGSTSYLAVYTILEFLGHICAQPRWIERRHRAS